MPHALDPNRWTRIESIFYAALDLEPAARIDFVKNQSQGDEEIANEVISLLDALSGSAGFLAQPISNVVKEIATEPVRDRLGPGSQLNHYQIVSKIGAGGMGEVYRALDTRLGRHIAVKVLAPYLTFDVPAFRRFKQEAHTASALNHPNILTIFEFGEMDGLHYIASELIDGPTLRQRLQQGRIELKTAVGIAIQIAGALIAAHASGIIHRDIKPENILIRSDGLVKLVDFGIAKLGEGRADEGSTAKPIDGSSNQTQAGMVVGTLRYMSPEQAQQLPVDGRSDIFTLGAVIYEMLACAPAFSGETHDEIKQRILFVDPPSFSDCAIEVPPELELIVSKALRKEVDARYQTARDLMVDLQQFQRKLDFEANLIRAGFTPSGSLRVRPAGESISGSISANRVDSGSHFDSPAMVPTAPAAKQRRTALGFAVATILLLVVAVAFLLFQNRQGPPSGDSPRSIAILPIRNLNQDATADFLEVSLADALITKLGYVKALAVRPSSDVKGLRKANFDPNQLATQLHVDLLLVGTYQKSGNSLHITTQLLDARRNAMLWRQTIDIPYDELLTVQDRLARQIIDGLSLKLTTAESQRLAFDRPENTTAYEYYLRGVDLYSLNEFSEAIDVLNKSIALDPDYALAWAQLGRAYTTHASLQFGGREQYVRAKAAYSRALSLDPGLLEVRVYMANLLTDTGRVEEAVPLLREALASNPGFAEAHWELGYAYRFAGMLDESAAEAEESRRLDPEVKINSSAINAYLYRGEYKKFLQSLPAGYTGYTLFYRGLAEYYMNQFTEAQNDFDRAYELDKTILPAPIGAGISYGLKHRPAEGLKVLEETEDRFTQQGVSDPEMLYKLAQGFAALGDSKSALRVLQKSAEGGFFCAPYLARDPLMNNLRDSPKFKELQSQIETRHEQFKQRFVSNRGAGG